MFSLKRLCMMVGAVACAAVVVTCSSSKNPDPGTTPDASTPDSGEPVVTITPPTDEQAGFQAIALADETRMVVSWGYNPSEEIDAKLVYWRVDWAKEGTEFPSQHTELLAKTTRQVQVDNLETAVTYKVFISGLDQEGKIILLGATKRLQSLVMQVTTGTPAFRGPFKATTSNDTDSPFLMSFNNGNLVLMHRTQGIVLKTIVSKDRGATWSSGPQISQNVSGLAVANDPESGQAIACYKNSLGVRAAISGDSGENWTESVVWDFGVADPDAGTQGAGDMEMGNCAVAILRNGHYLLVSDAKTSDNRYVVRIRESQANDDGTTSWNLTKEIDRAEPGEVAVMADPKLRGENQDKEMVYIAFVTKTTQDYDIQFAVSENGGVDWRTTTTADVPHGGPKAGTVLQVEDSVIRGGEQHNPLLAITPESGRVWAVFETRKAGVESIIIADSDDFFATSPSGWSTGAGKDIGTWVRSPHVRTEGKKLLIAFAASPEQDNTKFRPYLTRFDADAKVGAAYGKFESPQTGVTSVNMQLVADGYIAADQGRGAEIFNGPCIVGDGVVSRFVAWTGEPNSLIPNQGKIQLLISP